MDIDVRLPKALTAVYPLVVLVNSVDSDTLSVDSFPSFIIVYSLAVLLLLIDINIHFWLLLV